MTVDVTLQGVTADNKDIRTDATVTLKTTASDEKVPNFTPVAHVPPEPPPFQSLPIAPFPFLNLASATTNRLTFYS
eukprot:CAMPEP_0172496196 /NCGR_PEP_ID=MMETSP1066-20121228/83213_1 /TAXON_ID=671091 /ORGANISM="Coscinodiscus wailesii, Strain CCMP2513" /LENGTH=75 /DNA_ID=CAMNT_0013268373 /DNA_START=16 /DNA_END=243 /DNA_ORIENTATION=-